MIKRTEIILTHMWHSMRESSMMIALMVVALGVLAFLAISRVCQRISWGLTSDSKGLDGPDYY
jgi:predicted lysophospholipase L1 biosynthesis ABC-type transport system permease subunit